MLNPDADCPAAKAEKKKIMKSDYVKQLTAANQVN
jgi:hypothetical protein